ncbi:conserved hypothetical protein [Candidatus Desulfarcum epimagneticum]|uniref:Uncharacterized protein n=1 Tax=uncultured Desulfobacteraceae bacterium TaxID=218296 RepID=A0A484HM09_9BACT|nr:conserved hypothetical protein [uncultured Desulfobacteraceae bacterium]
MTPAPEKYTVTRAERYVGFGALLALAAIALGFYTVQYRFNPAVSARQALSESSVATDSFSLADLAPAGIEPFSPPERFGPDTLSDKINGKAELYFSAGFRSLKTQRFALTADPALWFEMFVYDMGAARDAFSVFSMQRRGDLEPGGPTPFAYATPNGRFLARGRHYLELVGSEASDSLMAAADEMAAAFVDRIGADDARAPELDLFPEDNRTPGSLSLVASDAFGITGFNQVFMAQYRQNGADMIAYVARRESAAAAQLTAETVRDFYLEFGGVSLGGPEGVAVIDILDTIEVVLHQGRRVIGAHEAPDRETALALVERIRKRLREIGDDGY